MIIIISSIVIGVMLVLTFRRGRQAPEFETVPVSRGDLVQSIFASGEAKAKNRRELNFSGGGDVVVVAVAEGDEVTEGQLLAVLDQQSLKEALTQAEINLKRARADLDYAGETRRLFLEEHKYDDTSTEELFAQFGQQDAQVRKAVAAVELATSQVKSAKISLNNSTLTSPLAGTVVEVNVKEGELFSSSQPAIIVADLSSFVFEAEVDESEIEKIEVSQKVRITLDAYSGIEFEGWVSELAKTTTLDSSGNKVVEVGIELRGILGDEEGLLLGLSGDAEIVFEEKKDILLAPLEAVFSENGEDFVFVVEGKKLIKRGVSLGLEDEDLIEVVKGLREGEEVVVERLEEVRKGGQSRPRMRFLGH